MRIYVRFGSRLYVTPRQITQSRAVDQKDDFLSLIGRYILLTQAVASIHHTANERSGSQMSSIWKMYNKVSSSVTEVALSPWSLMVRYGFNRWNWTRWKDAFQSKTLQQKARASTWMICFKKWLPLCVSARPRLQYIIIKIYCSLFRHTFVFSFVGVTTFHNFLKGTVHTNEKTLLLFTHPHVVPNPHAFIYFCKGKKHTISWIM